MLKSEFRQIIKEEILRLLENEYVYDNVYYYVSYFINGRWKTSESAENYKSIEREADRIKKMSGVEYVEIISDQTNTFKILFATDDFITNGAVSNKTKKLYNDPSDYKSWFRVLKKYSKTKKPMKGTY